MPSSRELLLYRRLGLVEEEEPLSPHLQRRVRRIRRLRRDLGFPYEAIAVIVRLVERVEELEERR
jgi:DNA-binding transcriptional MerR regulator